MNDKWIARNEITNKYEEVFPEDELPIGATVIRLYYHDGKYVTIPGASLYKIVANGMVELT